MSFLQKNYDRKKRLLNEGSDESDFSEEMAKVPKKFKMYLKDEEDDSVVINNDQVEIENFYDGFIIDDEGDDEYEKECIIQTPSMNDEGSISNIEDIITITHNSPAKKTSDKDKNYFKHKEEFHKKGKKSSSCGCPYEKYDEDKLFALSLVSSLRKITDDVKLETKIEILRILQKAQRQSKQQTESTELDKDENFLEYS